MEGRSGTDKAEEAGGTRSCRALNVRLGSLVYPQGDGSHGRVKAGEGHNQSNVLESLLVPAAVRTGRRGDRGPVRASSPGRWPSW